MVSLTALRQHPRFGRFFEVVHPFFWPVIWWTLNAVFRAYDASNRTEFLLGITWWGRGLRRLRRRPAARSADLQAHPSNLPSPDG
jgi:hypothetical protein